MERMERTDGGEVNENLDALFSQYREACPGAEASADFMPQLWAKIEARRATVSSSWFRLWAEVWLVATLTVAIVIGGILIPRFENPPAYQASYVDVLTAADSVNDAAVLPVGETQ
ncbi:MAG: hypothetical protein M3O20_04415 [Acidobacteriota bacterium]|nr:hypothetical protein [Acidobacteriota bacterium]